MHFWVLKVHFWGPESALLGPESALLGPESALSAEGGTSGREKCFPYHLYPLQPAPSLNSAKFSKVQQRSAKFQQSSAKFS